MFERLKFKRRPDSASSSSVALPGPKAEATPEESALFSVPSSTFVLPPPHLLSSTGMPVSTSSISSSLVYSNCNGNNDSGHGLGRSSSCGSAHLRQKASLTSLNNYSNNAEGVGHLFATMSPVIPYSQDPALDTTHYYKVPIPTVDDDNTIKVPVADTTGRLRSQTTTSYDQHNNITSTVMTPSVSAPALATDAEKRSSQGPKINPATKPSAGSFVGAIVTSATPSSTIEFESSNNSSSSTINANITNNTGVPASSASSATPSRSSSTSNRGGAGMSTSGSFTPVSATPPMTPRMAPNE
ncbi:hypothetical protein BGZ65_006811, partial [Modicella reniformis]